MLKIGRTEFARYEYNRRTIGTNIFTAQRTVAKCVAGWLTHRFCHWPAVDVFAKYSHNERVLGLQRIWFGRCDMLSADGALEIDGVYCCVQFEELETYFQCANLWTGAVGAAWLAWAQRGQWIDRFDMSPSVGDKVVTNKFKLSTVTIQKQKTHSSLKTFNT